MLDYVASRTETLRQKRRRKIVLYIVATAVAGILVVLFFLIRSNIFQIKEIRIQETNTVSKIDINNFVENFLYEQSDIKKWIFGERNIISLNGDEMKEKMLNRFPSVQKISIEKNITQGYIKISLEERQKMGLWCVNEQCMWFDETGTVFLDGLQAEGNIIYMITDSTGKSVDIGQKILPEYQLKNLFGIYDFLNKISWNTKHIFFENATLGEFKTQSVDEKPIIYFNITNDPRYAINSVNDIKNQKLEYIDLRVEGRVYYK